MTWCQTQETQCPLICLQTSANSATTKSNQCDWQSLTYSCVCANGLSPNVTEFSQTLPYYICQEWGTQCVSNCNGDASCQSACRQDHPCGAQDPTRQNSSTISTKSMHSTTSGAPTTNNGAASATTDSLGQTLYSGPLGAAPTGGSNDGDGAETGTHRSAGSTTVVRVWALSAGQTFGSLGLLGALFGGFALLL